MQPLSDVVLTPEALGRRAAELSRKLAAKLVTKVATKESSPERVFELCRDFDEAIEFAALEGVTVAEAIVSFVEDGWPAGWPPEYEELARIVGYCSPGIDVGSLTLPVMPKQASRLLRTASDDLSIAEIESMTAADPVLAGRLIGAANSAQFGSRFEIVRPRDAIMRLGIPEVRRLLLANCFAGLFASKALQDLWQHSQEVATLACELASLAGIDPDAAYLAGLLHDIGRLGLAKCPGALRAREQDWIGAGFPVVYGETLSYGTDHAELGALLLDAWELPDGIVEAVRFHHRPERSKSGLASLLNLAEDLAARAAGADSEDLWPDMRRASACLRAGISHGDFEAFRVGGVRFRGACA